MQKILLFHPWEAFFPLSAPFDRILFTASDGQSSSRPLFLHQPARLAYDRHGYEEIVSAGGSVRAARFVPDQTGPWKWRAMSGETVLDEGWFECVPSENPGYIELSPDDPRYFRFSSGKAFVPIGLNLAWPQYYRLPRGGEFLTLDEYGTMGCKDYGRWFSKLQAAGANFARVWLSHPYLNPENDSCPKVMLTSSGVAYPYLDSKHDGELDLEKLKRLDEVVDLARKHGIYLMLCLEHFRHIHCQDGEALSRPRWNSMKGGAPENMDEWFQQPLWQDLWFQKVNAVTARYGNDPIIMAWELWNEIDCCETSSWNVQQEWTAATLAKIKFLCPKNLVTNSLGSFDTEEKIAFQNDFKMEEMDFQQVHRYLDQGSRLPICSNPVELGIDAIKKSSRHNRPIILSETGGVNDSHTGPFRFYRADDDGLIFHDVTYPAFFAGSAGSGHIWHWEEYVDQKNLWHGYKALSDLLQDVQPDREKYEALELSTPEAWVYVLSGRSSLLGWVRNRKDTWQNVLRDGKISAPVEGLNLDVSTLKLGDSQQPIELFRPWPADASGQPKQVGHNILFPDFTHGFLFRILRA